MIMFDRRLLENFNWVLLALVLVILGLGILNLYSASSAFQPNGSSAFLKQVYWMLIGLSVMVGTLFFHYHLLKRMAYTLYACGTILLLLVLIMGKATSGAQRWIDLGFFAFQPSEPIKVIVVIALAQYFSRHEYPNGLGYRELVGPGLLVGLPFLLIVVQPDLGTAMHLAFACLSVLFFLRVQPGVTLGLAATMAAVLPVAWKHLKAYQKQRIFTFLNPASDPGGAGYHIIQSKIAVGSGQFWGKGFTKGTQAQLRFLPERHTDFVFSVFSEEWGFIGSVVLLLLFFGLIIAGLQVVLRSQDRFGALLVLGLTMILFWQIIINISMVVGLMPVVGLPLPFISYGGTSLVTTLFSIGIILNVSMRRFMFQE